MPFDAVRVGENLRKIRKEKKITQIQLSQMINKEQTYISKIELGTPAAIETYSDIADALNVSLFQLFEGNSEEGSNLHTINQSHTLHIPLISPDFKVCAGDGNCYEDMPLEFEGTHELNSPEISALYNDDGLIAMRVEGDSMIGKRIYDGDTVIFDRSHDYTTGNICLVCLDGRFMIKGLISQGAGKPPILRSANPEYRDIVVSEDSQFAVLGRLITVDPKNFNPGSII